MKRSEQHNQEIIGRIKQIIGDLTQKHFSKMISVHPVLLNRYLTGAEKCGNAFLYAIVKNLNINPRWLETGEGDMYYVEADMNIKYLANITSDTSTQPLFSIIAQKLLQEWSKEKFIYAVYPYIENKIIGMDFVGFTKAAERIFNAKTIADINKKDRLLLERIGELFVEDALNVEVFIRPND